MSRADYADPTKCDRCLSSVERGWSERWRAENKDAEPIRVECICFDCDEMERITEYQQDKVLTTRFMTSAVCSAITEQYRKEPGSRSYGEPPHRFINTYLEANESVKRLQVEVKKFEQAVWFSGLQAQVLAAEFRGFRMNFGNVIALVYSLAGRTQITIESINGDKQISLITADDEKRPVMGINSISATEEDAMKLMVTCREAYERGYKFTRNDKVGLGI